MGGDEKRYQKTGKGEDYYVIVERNMARKSAQNPGGILDGIHPWWG